MQRLIVILSMLCILPFGIFPTRAEEAIIPISGTNAFVSTTGSIIPEADPLQGVPMVQNPAANNYGTAELLYPIDIPKGRNNIQPDADLHYSSATENGCMGVGWNIEQPAITIDTRWGVPRYSEIYETESYLLNGAQLILHDETGEVSALPHQNTFNEFPRRSVGQVEFYLRDTRRQERVVRRGLHLDDFWWEVTENDGTKYYYGYAPATHRITENAVVRTAEGAIAYWALTAIVDLYGNYAEYSYEKDENEVYLTDVRYTGNTTTGLPPKYRIHFHYGTSPSEPATNCRLGVVQKKNKLLYCISVLYKDSCINQYSLVYENGAQSLGKSRLKRINKFERPRCERCMDPTWSSMELKPELYVAGVGEYAEKQGIMNGEEFLALTEDDIPIANPGHQTIFTYEDAVAATELYTYGKAIAVPCPFSSSTQKSLSTGGTFTVGFGSNPAITSSSVGANYSYTSGTGSINSALTDLDGDGLTDIVYSRQNKVYYCKQRPNGTFASSVPVNGLNRLSQETSSTHSFGVQADFVANISINPTLDKTYIDTYLADVNADGLPDMITPNGVLINRLRDGVPSFGSENDADIQVSNSCCGVIHRNGNVDTRLECINRWVLDTVVLKERGLGIHTKKEATHLQDYYSTRYDKPYRDTSRELKPPTFQYADAVSSADIPLSVPEPAFKSIPPELVYSPHYTDSRWENEDYRTVIRGDSLYVYHIETLCRDTALLPAVDVVRVWVAPRDGTVSMESRIRLLPDQTASRMASRKADGVKYYIQYNKTLLDSATIGKDSYKETTRSYNRLHVRKNDIFLFRLSSNQDRRFDDTDWEQTFTYLNEQGDYPYNSSSDYICTGNTNFVAPATGDVTVGYAIQNDQSADLAVYITHNTNPLTTEPRNAIFHVEEGDSICYHVYGISSEEPRWSDVHIQPFVGFMADSASLAATDTVWYHPDIRIDYSSTIPSDTARFRRLFGPLHRGWGQFAYNNSAHDDIIDIDSLYNAMEHTALAIHKTGHENMATQYSDTINLHDRNAINAMEEELSMYSPLTNGSKWIQMIPDSRTEQWQVYGGLGCIGRHIHSCSQHLQDHETSKDTSWIEYDSAIPIQKGNATVTTVRKQTSSWQLMLSGGYSFGVAGLNASAAYGSYSTDMDYMDMNGDGLPDFIGKTAIQYSTPWGGIGKNITPVNNTVESHTVSSGKGVSAAKTNSRLIPTNSLKVQRFHDTSLGGGGSSSQTWGKGDAAYMDINGDGLPDLVDSRSGKIWYNIGYEFVYGGLIQGLSICESLSNNTAVSGSLSEMESQFAYLTSMGNNPTQANDFSYYQYSISGGINASTSLNQTLARLIDIDGDGLPDIVRSHPKTGEMTVSLYAKGHFGPPQHVRLQAQRSITGNIGVHGGVTAGFSPAIIPVKFCFGIQITPYVLSETRTYGDFIDMNGDGYPDYVSQSPVQPDRITVYYNQNGLRPVNMLTKITNPTGQEIQLSYKQTTPSAEQRGRRWVLSRTDDMTFSGREDDPTKHLIKQFKYEDPYYDNFEKTHYGYAKVTTIENNERIIEETYSNRDFLTHGENLSYKLLDINGRPYIEHRHTAQYTDTDGDSISSVCQDARLLLSDETFRTYYYEGKETPSITTQYSLKYDKRHNIIRYVNYGDTAFPDDDWKKETDYADADSLRWSYNLISLPLEERTYSHTGKILRKRTAGYNAYGKPQWIAKTDSARNIHAITCIEYDGTGNIALVSLPGGASAEPHEATDRPWISYTYDNETHTYPIRTENQWRETTYAEYDLRFGLPIKEIDPSGTTVTYDYDCSGRLKCITKQHEAEKQAPFTLYYNYRLPNYDLQKSIIRQDSLPYIITLSLTDGVAEAASTIYDPRGFPIQRKRLAHVRDSLQWLVWDCRWYDMFYRTQKRTLPFITHTTAGALDKNSRQQETELRKYDILDRPIDILNFDGTLHTTWYGFDKDQNNRMRLCTTVTDENRNKTDILKDTQGNIIQTRKYNDKEQSAPVCYTYNETGELIRTEDADGYVTTCQYDLSGNCIERNHPDGGRTQWFYNNAGLPAAKVTAQTRTTHDSILYDYCYDRLQRIRYPYHPENNVTYRYKNGKLVFRSDGTGMEIFGYDDSGNVNCSHRRIIVPSETNAYHFTTKHYYDSSGRIRSIVYPDGDSVIYNYQWTGELKSILHQPLQGRTDTLLKHISYNERGQEVKRIYGNGVETDYQYDTKNGRLTRIKTYTLQRVLQDLNYRYDGAGNIIQAEQPADESGGNTPYSNEYGYNCMNRLVSIKPEYGSLHENFFTEYSPAGRAGYDFCSHINGDREVIYGYDDNRQTHQPKVFFNNLTKTAVEAFWDENGNMAQLLNRSNGDIRFHEWDEENRLRFAVGQKWSGGYGYDADGVRIWKLAGYSAQTQVNGNKRTFQINLDHLTLYPNPYITITPRYYTKHYYAGNSRIATTLGRGGFEFSEDSIEPIAISRLSPAERQKMATFHTRYRQEYPFGVLRTEPTKNTDTRGVLKDELQYKGGSAELEYMETDTKEDLLLYPMTQWRKKDCSGEEDVFYTHTDHLGTANIRTDSRGLPVEQRYYSAYGDLIWRKGEEKGTLQERFAFTGKERDRETGYDYFGARYYSQELGMWLSVDPLAYLYPDMTPYAYCNWNPINRIDPDGRIVYFAKGVSPTFKKDFRIAVNYMNSNGISYMLYKLNKSPYIYYIAEGELFKSSCFDTKTRTIKWSSRTGIITDNLYEMSPVEVLNHEIDHALQYDSRPQEQQIDGNTYNIQYGNEEERRVIEGSEQNTARKLGKLKKNEVTRTNHNGSPYETNSPISNEDKNYYVP